MVPVGLLGLTWLFPRTCGFRYVAAARSVDVDTVLLVVGLDEILDWIGGEGNAERLDVEFGAGTGDWLRERRLRDRDRDRERTDWAMAPKKERSAGEAGDCVDEIDEVGEMGAMGEKYDVGGPEAEGGDKGVVDEVDDDELIGVVVIVRGGEAG